MTEHNLERWEKLQKLSLTFLPLRLNQSSFLTMTISNTAVNCIAEKCTHCHHRDETTLFSRLTHQTKTLSKHNTISQYVTIIIIWTAYLFNCLKSRTQLSFQNFCQSAASFFGKAGFRWFGIEIFWALSYSKFLILSSAISSHSKISRYQPTRAAKHNGSKCSNNAGVVSNLLKQKYKHRYGSVSFSWFWYKFKSGLSWNKLWQDVVFWRW